MTTNLDHHFDWAYALSGGTPREALLAALAASRLDEDAPVVCRRMSWDTSKEPDGLLGLEARLTTISDRGYQAIYVIDGDIVVSFIHSANTIELETWSRPDQNEAVDLLIHDAQQHYPITTPGEDVVRFKFWFSSGRGPQSHNRDIAADAWADVKDNYGEQVRQALGALMHEFTPSHGGQLLLWHGAPGTGKSHAIRAMAREWNSWCEFNYVVDPERFFRDSDYMLAVLLNRESRIAHLDDDDDADRPKQWRVFVLEDTGELLAADAKDRTGQGLSRLLNVVDGILGQGLRVLILITTNEDLGRLHPAVIRPGRCASRIEFHKLTRAEADAWMRARGHDFTATQAHTLAELYATIENFGVANITTPRLGFRA